MSKREAFIEVQVIPLELAQQLARELTSDELVEFVKELDICRGEWEVTRELRNFFVAEMETLEGLE